MASPLRGMIPPLVTPFTETGDLDEKAFRAQVRFMLSKGVHGICVGGSTGEGHTLERDELRRLAAVALEEAGGRIPVVVGIIANSTREAVLRARAVQDLGVAALQVTPVHYLFKPDDTATLGHFRALTEASPIPVIIYNVIPWNYLHPDLLVRIMTELAGVQGVKQSQGDLKLMADLLLMAPAGKAVLSAVDALLYPSFALGAHGAIAATLTAVPGPSLALWHAVQRGDHARALAIHKALLRFWNSIAGDNLPAAVKYALERQGIPAGAPRAPTPPTTPAQRAAIDPALDAVLAVAEQGSAVAAQ
jgi:4-hydroxy-tetrahydrodipicolinate synthase